MKKERRGHGTVGTTEKKRTFLAIYRRRKTCNITKACEGANIGRRTFYRWMEDINFREAVEAINESIIDWAEEMLRKRIDAGSDAAVIFLLKCRAKKRGYVEKIEHELSGGITTKIERVITDDRPEE